MKRRFREWMRREIVDAVEPQIAVNGAEMQRAVDDAAAAIRQAVHHEAAAAHAEMVELRLEHERAMAQLTATLDRIGDELDASHATTRALLARLRALEANRSRTHVVGGTIDGATTDTELPDIDLAALDVATPAVEEMATPDDS